MKIIKLTLFILLNTYIVNGQIDNQSISTPQIVSNKSKSKYFKKYIYNFNKIVRSNSIYADSLDWHTINTNIAKLSIGLKAKEDAHILSDYVLSELRQSGENHSFYMKKVNVNKFSDHNTDGRQPFSKLIDNHIGYIYVPGFNSVNDTTCSNFAIKIQKLIEDLDSRKTITGWIIDLRENSGGNMYPMIAGLGPIVGEGTLGYFINPKSKKTDKWYYSNGSSGEGNKPYLTIKKPYSLKTLNSKVAVLISSMTGSSGEMTAVSFIGKENVKILGQNSGGYTTGNQGYKLLDGSYLYLAVSYISDRNNKKYLGSISPDILVDEKDDNDTISIAQKWLDSK
ncbi:MAG: S41 family peptidase [Bacteroidetes bacterium]|nr:S41 family peptidase [Bacteroidota bacterium]